MISQIYNLEKLKIYNIEEYKEKENEIITIKEEINKIQLSIEENNNIKIHISKNVFKNENFISEMKLILMKLISKNSKKNLIKNKINKNEIDTRDNLNKRFLNSQISSRGKNYDNEIKNVLNEVQNVKKFIEEKEKILKENSLKNEKQKKEILNSKFF